MLIDLFSLKFICNECGKRFGLKKNLKSHLQIQHTTERPTYVCPKRCGKTCTTPYNLKIHVLLKHDENMDLESLKKCNEPGKKSKRKLDWLKQSKNIMHSVWFIHSSYISFCFSWKTKKKIPQENWNLCTMWKNIPRYGKFEQTCEKYTYDKRESEKRIKKGSKW